MILIVNFLAMFLAGVTVWNKFKMAAMFFVCIIR